MLSGVYSKMGTDTFSRMPTSTNAVEAYNRVSKSGSTEPLNVAMLGTYKYDMPATLEHVARQKGISTSYEDMSVDAQRRRAQKQNLARRKRRARDDDAEGPPDKHHDFDSKNNFMCIEHTRMH